MKSIPRHRRLTWQIVGILCLTSLAAASLAAWIDYQLTVRTTGRAPALESLMLSGGTVIALSLTIWLFLHRLVLRPIHALDRAVQQGRDISHLCRDPNLSDNEIKRLAHTLDRTFREYHEAQQITGELLATQTEIFNSSTNSIVTTDAHGVIQSFNPGAEHMLGYSADEMIGRRTADWIHDPQEIADPC